MHRVLQLFANSWNRLGAALRARPVLEQLSWIAGIASAALAFFLWLASPRVERTPDSQPPNVQAVQSAGRESAPEESVARQSSVISFEDWELFKRYAAQKIVEVNPSITYTGKPPPVLRAIPIFDIDLNADGSIAKLRVRRVPSSNVRDVEMVAAAIRRAAPFGDISSLPRPWTFTESFLVNDDGKFKPVLLDRDEPATK
jgi:hypothetical protein